MKSVIALLGSKKIFHVTFVLIKSWFFFWLAISITSIVAGVYLYLVQDIYKAIGVLLPSFILLIKSILYIYVLKKAVKLFTEMESYSSSLEVISFNLLMLFFIDASSLFLGSTNGDSIKKTSILFLDVLNKDSTFYEFYSNVYIYIPAAFHFIRPELEGVSLLVLSVITAFASRRK